MISSWSVTVLVLFGSWWAIFSGVARTSGSAFAVLKLYIIRLMSLVVCVSRWHSYG